MPIVAGTINITTPSSDSTEVRVGRPFLLAGEATAGLFFKPNGTFEVVLPPTRVTFSVNSGPAQSALLRVSDPLTWDGNVLVDSPGVHTIVAVAERVGAWRSEPASITVAAVAPTCEVNVDRIWFDHDTAGLTLDAMSIRRSRSQQVLVPEWRRGQTSVAADSPAAYCIQETTGNPVAIKVRFTANPGLTFAWIAASGGGVLGAIDPIRVDFANGVSVPEFVEIPLNNHQIGSRVQVQNIEWQWGFRCPVENRLWEMDRTAHRIYVVMREPRGPWNQTPGSDENPWTEALDFACTVSPTSGLSDPYDALATGLAEKLNWGGLNANAARLEYDVTATVPHYAGVSVQTNFELTKFLERLNGGLGNGKLVNCTDCACIITTFANLLGCDLWEGQVTPTGVNPMIQLNPMIPIGRGKWWLPPLGDLPSAEAPSPGGWFNYHEVAWKGDTVLGAPIWDICFLLNGLAEPARPQQPPIPRFIYYPYGVTYADTNVFDYREKLAEVTGNNVATTLPDASTKVRRPIV